MGPEPSSGPTGPTPALLGALLGSGIEAPWSHQVEVAEAAHAGRHVVVATGTASGKSLGYHLPILTDLLVRRQRAERPRRDGALPLPDQGPRGRPARAGRGLALPASEPRPMTATPRPTSGAGSATTRTSCSPIPTCCTTRCCPGTSGGARSCAALRYVVVDECHVYKGVFGAHQAAVLRRLRRVAPVTAPTRPSSSPRRRWPNQRRTPPGSLGYAGHPVTRDGSPRAAMTFALWEPPLSIDGAGRPKRVSTMTEAGGLLARACSEGVQTVAFARSRAGVEVVARIARRAGVGHELERAGGGLPRWLPAGGATRAGAGAAQQGEFWGSPRPTPSSWASTSAASTRCCSPAGRERWRRSGSRPGRAGRSGERSLAVLVAADDPLDTFVVHHPESIFGRGVESTVVDPDNPHVLASAPGRGRGRAALTEADLELFGPQTRVAARRPGGPRHPQEATARLVLGARRPAVRPPLAARCRRTGRVIETRTGRVVGTVDDASAHSQVHTGAVHVHQGQAWVVTELDLDEHAAMAVRGDPGWSTHAQSVSEFEIVRELEHEQWGPLRCSFGAVTRARAGRLVPASSTRG